MARTFLPVLLLMTLTLAACSPGLPAAAPPVIPAPGLADTSAPEMPSPAVPSATPRPVDATATTAPAGPMPTATPTPHPMSIQALRDDDFPGSPITLEQELEPGANYRRFYASYLSEGLKIYALLTLPNGEMPAGGWPAIVFNHGYIPPDVYVTTERYIAYVDRLARAGYIVFRIDYRGHDRSEGAARGAYGDPGYMADVLNALAALRQYPAANPDKIGMWGHSMGGFLTLRAMVVSPDVKAGVIWAGVVGSYPDMLYNWRRSIPTSIAPTPPAGARRWRQQWLDDYGTPEENPAFWNSVSANSYLADLSGPVQLHHGTADEDVPLEFSHMLEEQIRAAGGTVELYTYEGDNHNIANYFTAAMNETVAFFDRYLK